MVVPSVIEKLPKDWLDDKGGGTSAQFNTFASAYAPLAFPILFAYYGIRQQAEGCYAGIESSAAEP